MREKKQNTRKRYFVPQQFWVGLEVDGCVDAMERELLNGFADAFRAVSVEITVGTFLSGHSLALLKQKLMFAFSMAYLSMLFVS